jgi:CxxC motif-containing protein (DUF1111 family)
MESSNASPEGVTMRLSVLAFSLVGSLVTVAAVSDRPQTFGDPFPGLTPSQKLEFDAGLVEFSDIENIEDGFGPVFNEASCAACHVGPGTAIGGSNDRLETRFGKITNGQFDPMTSAGGSLLQDHSIGLVPGHEYKPETVPADATIVARRRTTSLFGLGLVDAVPDVDFIALAASEALGNDGTAGRVSMVSDLIHGGTAVGKFGWKAQVPNLMQFSADAYLNEMGITTPIFPNENCPSGVCGDLYWNPVPAINNDGKAVIAFNNFMTMLDAPPRGKNSGEVVAGEKIFDSIGCGSCHVASMKTGSSDIPALRHRPFHPYSDFLLHDMGSLGDGIAQGTAGALEMRTAPLWGLRVVTRFLHDGRASTIEAAILAHDGQGRAARDRFAALDAGAKAKLLAFLNSL